MSNMTKSVAYRVVPQYATDCAGTDETRDYGNRSWHIRVRRQGQFQRRHPRTTIEPVIDGMARTTPAVWRAKLTDGD